jgi:AcrR family transcriptional regulator
MELFFEKGYEETSIRGILDVVGGEIGMFYHYFKSKGELFQVVVEKFFLDYRKGFIALTARCNSIDEFVDSFLEYYRITMVKFNRVSDNMHWTIRYAFAARIIEELQAPLLEMLVKLRYHGSVPIDMATGQLLYGISGTIHSQSFPVMSVEEQRGVIMKLINKLLKP